MWSSRPPAALASRTTNPGTTIPESPITPDPLTGPTPPARAARQGRLKKAVLVLVAMGGLWDAGGTLDEVAHPAVPVLCFHAVGPSHSPADMAMRLDRFQAILAAVERAGYLPALPKDLDSHFERWSWSRPRILLTFDDGHESHLSRVAPELRARGWPAVYFINSFLTGPHRLAPGQVTLLASRSSVIGSHGRRHSSFLKGPLEPPARYLGRLRDEILLSRTELQSLTGQPVEALAYPFGEVSPEARAMVAAAGYRWAFTVEHGYVTRDSDPFELPRIMLIPGRPLEELEDDLWSPLFWPRLRLLLDLLVIVLTVLALKRVYTRPPTEGPSATVEQDEGTREGDGLDG